MQRLRWTSAPKGLFEKEAQDFLKLSPLVTSAVTLAQVGAFTALVGEGCLLTEFGHFPHIILIVWLAISDLCEIKFQKGHFGKIKRF